ncbi:MAG: hypothetical protein ACPG7F_17045 [Aggregatilineales bacterium]
MGFRFKWLNDEKKVMVYEASGDWNWRDFHAVARAASFSTYQSQHAIDILLDLRESTRTALPSGLRVHLRTLGKKHTPAMTGRAIVIGFPVADESQVALDDNRSFATSDGRAYLVNDESELSELLERWHDNAAGNS